MSTLAVEALGGDERPRSRGQPAAIAAAQIAVTAETRVHELLATPRTV
jgi:hypothetical protein